MKGYVNKSKIRYQSIALALVLLFSVGQSLAFYKSCEMNSTDHSNHTSVHSTHESVEQVDTQTMDSNDEPMMKQNAGDDCCDNNCACPQGSCSSASIFAQPSQKLNSEQLAYLQLFDISHLDLNNYPSSLYRPPISC